MTLTRRDLIVAAGAAVAGSQLGRLRVESVSADPFCLVPTPRWSDPATWGGAVPAPGASVTLPATTVVLDVDVTVGELSIPPGGKLVFDPTTSRTLSASGNVVVSGALTMQPNSPTVVHALRFPNVIEANFVGGGMSPIPSDVGLWVIGDGTVEAAGSPKTPWTRAVAAVAQGATTIPLASAPTGWQVGDELVITPTAGHAISNPHDRYSTVTLTGVSGATVAVTATQNAHPLVNLGDGMVVGAEVLNLTRNVRIEGTPTGRSHTFWRSTKPVDISHVAFRFLGPRRPSGAYTEAVLGRYPLHIHMAGDASRGSRIVNCVATGGTRGFVPHLSNGTTFDGCIAHDVFENGFWWDVASAGTLSDPSDDTTWTRCVASRVKSDPAFRGFRITGFSLGQGANCRATDSVAVGIQGNGDASGFGWVETANTPWAFERNLSHNNARHGIFVWQNNDQQHVVRDFACYNNGGAGISHGAYRNGYRFVNAWLFANRTASIIGHATAVIQGLQFERIVCDGDNQQVGMVVLPRHTLPGGRPVELLGVVFRNHAGPTVSDEPTVASSPTLLDLVECTGVGGVVFTALSNPAAVVRVQNGPVATEYTPAGSAAVAPFSTYEAAAPTPFAI
jgi:hypothetical protein